MNLRKKINSGFFLLILLSMLTNLIIITRGPSNIEKSSIESLLSSNLSNEQIESSDLVDDQQKNREFSNLNVQTQSSPIVIDENADFFFFSGWSGAGTENDPLIYKDAFVESVSISNTNLHFIMENVWVNNSNQYGFYINNVTNGNFFNNTASFNTHGFLLENSINNTLANNNIHENDQGIYLINSSKNNITKNTVYKNGQYGVSLDFTCNNNNIEWNTFLQNNNGGLQASDESNNNSFKYNHWNDQTTPDSNSDGFTDTPYEIIRDNGGLRFDGTVNNYVIKDPVNTFATDEITVEFWVKSYDNVKTGTWISYAPSDATNNEITILNYLNEVNINLDGGNVVTGITIRENEWTHLVVTWRSSDRQTTLWKNGILEDTSTMPTSSATNNIIDGGGSLVLGQDQDCVGGCFDGTQAFDGVLDEVRILDRVLSKYEIKSNYDSRASYPVLNGTIAWYHLDAGNNAIDSAGGVGDAIIHGATWTNGVNTYDNGALSFDGTVNDYVIKNPVNNFVSDAFTLELWVKSYDTTRDGFMISYAPSDSANNEIILCHIGFVITVYVKGTAIGTTTQLTENLWTHLVVTWRSSDGQITLWTDAIPRFTGYVSGNQLIDAGGSLVLGQDQDTVGGGFHPTQAFNGVLDEVRILNRVITQAEIEEDYNSNAYYPTRSGTVAWFHLDDAGNSTIDSAEEGATNATIYGTTRTKGVIPSNYGGFTFNGFNNYVRRIPVISFPSTEITAEFWVKSYNIAKEAYLISYAYKDNDNEFLIGHVNNQVRITIDGGYLDTGVSLSKNIWTHLVVTWRSTDRETTLWKNGIHEYTGTMSTGTKTNNIIDGGGSLVLGQDQDSVGGTFDPNQAYEGVLDEFRILNRILNQTEIEEDYNSRAPYPSRSGTVAWYHLDDAGFYAIDSAGGAGHALYLGPIIFGTYGANLYNFDPYPRVAPIWINDNYDFKDFALS
ncbi:MAG: LamG-like jellyroll fold domain-containing protein, partial [Candidatus Hodarchaeales archaeon]